jgi:two-component system chemotaxis sensor kinase CheA
VADELNKIFRREANDIVERLTQGLIAVRQGAGPPGPTRELMRLAHTLKGAAHVVRETEIAQAAHAMEDQLTALGDAALPPEAAAQLLAKVEGIAQRLRVPADGPATEERRPEEQPAHASDDVFRTVRVDVDELDQVLHGVNEALMRAGAVRPALASLDRAASLAAALQRHLLRERGAEAVSARAQTLAEGLTDTLAGTRRKLAQMFEHLDRELRSLADTAGQLRLVPVRALLVAMQRAALATAEATGKRVAFTTSGGDLRIEAQLLSSLREALFHVVRNSVVHGIETPAQRRAAGKAAAGQVAMRVKRRGRDVIFTCTDDGGGVDVERVRRLAVERGYTDARAAGELSEEALLGLLLRPGVSTTARVTPFAGRGVGLDVVAAAAAQLHGTVRVRTQAGRGTTVELIVPASLVSTAAVLVEVAGATVAVPTESIRQTVSMSQGDIVRAGPRLQFALGPNVLLPYLPLARMLGKDGEDERAQVALILDAGGTMAAVGVSRLAETATVVVRTLPALVRAHPVIGGVSADFAGKPLLVLDPAGLVATAAAGDFAAEPPRRAQPLPVLIIDDSLTTRMLEQSILEAAGYSVDLAVSGEDALQKARGRDYGLFLVDIEMPGMDGFQFIEAAKAEAALDGVPSILVSSRSSAADRARGEAVGASDYVVKSEFNQQFLLDRIRQLVRMR